LRPAILNLNFVQISLTVKTVELRLKWVKNDQTKLRITALRPFRLGGEKTSLNGG